MDLSKVSAGKRDRSDRANAISFARDTFPS
jgi:hypothetical protein